MRRCIRCNRPRTYFWRPCVDGPIHTFPLGKREIEELAGKKPRSVPQTFMFLSEILAEREKQKGHWAEGFTPSTEIEMMMGRPVDPVEEADVRVRLRSMLDSEGH